MSNEPEFTDEDVQRLENALKTLTEYYDAVHIFANRAVGEEDGNTIFVSRGRGNWFARYGQVKEWVIRSEELTKVKARKEDDADSRE